MKKYKIGLVIGRFQPFHLGHKYVIEKALKVCEKIYIGIGSSQIFDERNPYSTEKRKEFLNAFIENEGIRDGVIGIVTTEDVADDDEWFADLIKKIPGTEVVIGDNEWVNGIFERHAIPALRIGYYKRNILEGTKIRKSMQEKKPWKKRVPEYLISHIEKDKE